MSRSARALLALVGGCVVVAACATSSGTAASSASGVFAVAAQREPLSTDSRSVVAHDTEVDALVVHSGELFAATDQWEYPSPSAAGQVLVKRSARGPWAIFQRTGSLRVQALDSFPLPSDQGLAHGHSLLITQAIVDGHSRVEWLLDGAHGFTTSESFRLASNGADVRAFGAHEADGAWAVYTGVNPTGILRGVWSKEKHTLVFDPKPELTVAPPGSKALKTQKVTGFADCAGALYVTINTRLYRRNDGSLPHGISRWELVYDEGPVGAFNSGLRGLTCVHHNGAPALLLSTEGDGDVYRFDHLPHGQLRFSGAANRGLRPVLEWSPIPAIRSMLAAQGTTVPAAGTGAIGYVIAAYNNGDFQTIRLGGAERQVFGFEWGYDGDCPQTRECGPIAFGAVHFNAAACFAIRTDHGSRQSYEVRCLAGRTLTPSTALSDPIRSGQAFVSIRTTQPSPFHDRLLYYAGYDCNFYPADGTAWVATSKLSAIHP